MPAHATGLAREDRVLRAEAPGVETLERVPCDAAVQQLPVEAGLQAPRRLAPQSRGVVVVLARHRDAI